MSTRTASIQEEKLESSNFDDGTNSLFTYAVGKLCRPAPHIAIHVGRQLS